MYANLTIRKHTYEEKSIFTNSAFRPLFCTFWLHHRDQRHRKPSCRKFHQDRWVSMLTTRLWGENCKKTNWEIWLRAVAVLVGACACPAPRPKNDRVFRAFIFGLWKIKKFEKSKSRRREIEKRWQKSNNYAKSKDCREQVAIQFAILYSRFVAWQARPLEKLWPRLALSFAVLRRGKVTSTFEN